MNAMKSVVSASFCLAATLAAGGAGVGGIGHQSDLFGLHLKHQVEKFGAWIALDVEFGANQRTKQKHIVVTNVTLIGTWMYGDALRSKPFAINSYILHIGQIASARIAQCGYLVDIYT